MFHEVFVGTYVLYLLGGYVRMEWLGYMLISYLTFWEIAQLFSRLATLFCIPTSNVWRFSIDFNIFILYVTILLNKLLF